jgi:hypothetical protein
MAKPNCAPNYREGPSNLFVRPMLDTRCIVLQKPSLQHFTGSSFNYFIYPMHDSMSIVEDDAAKLSEVTGDMILAGHSEAATRKALENAVYVMEVHRCVFGKCRVCHGGPQV